MTAQAPVYAASATALATSSTTRANGTPLTLGYSPCPNDTFIFTAWTQGLLPDAPEVRERLDDIETLNRAAMAGEVDVVKVSFHAYGHLRERYALLRAGGALGRGCGPLVVAREPFAGAALARKRVAIPGELTTAALLVRLYAPELVDVQVLPFHRIMAAVQAGEVDAGVIIHESRFTYPRFGLSQVVDLGEWWEQETGHAIPLGGIAIRRDLGAERIAAVDRALAASVAYGHAHPDEVWPTVRRHAQEMEDDVMRAHIGLYVNDFTRDYGVEGETAIRHLLDTAERVGIVPHSEQPLFLAGS
ncbi:MAG: 1,4-dihydroxy-6-naphtoate synthase [uncultured Chloroflexi bacterium]|uniref:1,4-dihydroxy-6-naphtoate synthase n=1 Tax=uncultured Chloroflexota bacterium TaxID=166587 RepID=A0A6J4I607_9CHLR|nr:MAG: 1,4-dihydroxy-6-naphtoate synthase [uncultured Chloroflexota bacterium]